MIIGDPNRFAIESEIVVAFERRMLLAYGSFVVHIGGHCYGDEDSEETPLLSNALHEVECLLAGRGCHTAPFASEPDAGRIANACEDSYRDPIWTPDEEREWFCGLTQEEFRELIRINRCGWGGITPYLFSDVSNILQFDVGDRVRLIGFKGNTEGGWYHDPATRAEVWLGADEFYHILEEWRDAFEAEWAAVPKTPKSKDGAKSHIRKLRAKFGEVIDWDGIDWD